MRYFADFLDDNKYLIESEKLDEYRMFVKRNADSVWKNSKNDALKSFSAYWRDLKVDTSDEQNALSLVAAFHLFTACAKLFPSDDFDLQNISRQHEEPSVTMSTYGPSRTHVSSRQYESGC